MDCNLGTGDISCKCWFMVLADEAGGEGLCDASAKHSVLMAAVAWLVTYLERYWDHPTAQHRL